MGGEGAGREAGWGGKGGRWWGGAEGGKAPPAPPTTADLQRGYLRSRTAFNLVAARASRVCLNAVAGSLPPSERACAPPLRPPTRRGWTIRGPAGRLSPPHAAVCGHPATSGKGRWRALSSLSRPSGRGRGPTPAALRRGLARRYAWRAIGQLSGGGSPISGAEHSARRAETVTHSDALCRGQQTVGSWRCCRVKVCAAADCPPLFESGRGG